MGGKVHVSKFGTYHPAPCKHNRAGSRVCDCPPVWTVNDTRGYLDGGPACDECGACECEPCPDCGHASCSADHMHKEGYVEGTECIGLSFCFVCLDGGEVLCPACAEKAGVKIVPCDCE